MVLDDPLRRLEILRRDLAIFTETRLQTVDRLANQIDANIEDLKKLLSRAKKNEASRRVLMPGQGTIGNTIKIDGEEFSIAGGTTFRDYALIVADELDLDEVEAAKLCILSPPDDVSVVDTDLPFRALIRFHNQRLALLDCVRLLLQLSLDSDDERADSFQYVTKSLIQGEGRPLEQSSAYWRRCVDGLSDIEAFLQKIADHKQKLLMTGQSLSGNAGETLQIERSLLTQQHECLASIMSFLIRGNYVQAEDYRLFLSKAATLEGEIDITIHYLPVLISGSAFFGSDQSTTMEIAKDLHNLFATNQQPWKQPSFKAAATVFWLAEYSSRTTSTDHSSDATKEYSDLFTQALASKAFHFILAAATFLKPVVWHEPSRVDLIEFLMSDSFTIPSDLQRASDDFSTQTMRELQVFTDAFVTYMPDMLRKLRTEEDETRRNTMSTMTPLNNDNLLDLERFMVIMACAYQDDPEAARDFWSDRESNLYGFLRWSSQRLPTPRVAAFCQLLRSIASDERSANHAHRFLLEDTVMMGGKLRKANSICWNQIFSELELFSSTLKPRSAVVQKPGVEEAIDPNGNYAEPETGIMLDSYLGLATHICRASPDARNWILKDQPYHIGEGMFKLSGCDVPTRVRASCLDLLSALLVDRIPEVRNGIWALLEAWIDGGGKITTSGSTPKEKSRQTGIQFLQDFTANAETCASLVHLLNALIAPSPDSMDIALDALPFPEQLGAINRLTGIDRYVDFVLQSIFARRIPRMTNSGEASMVHLLRYDTLEFIILCLKSFDEDLVLLANISNVEVERAMETKSLLNYVRLHPFARVMEWLLNPEVSNALFAIIKQNADEINSADPGSPLVQSVLISTQVLNLAWKLQATFFDIVRPLLSAKPSSSKPVPSSVTGSIDELFLPHLGAVLDIALLMSSQHVDLGHECIELFKKICSSRKLSSSTVQGNERARSGNRLISTLGSMGPTLAISLRKDFIVEEWDLELAKMPAKFERTQSILKLLNASLDASDGRPSVAHCLLGFKCNDRTVDVLPGTTFTAGQSLFCEIANCAFRLPVTLHGSHQSWCLSIVRGCVDIILKLATSALTANLVGPVLRSLEFLPCLSVTLSTAASCPFWDSKPTADPNLLHDSSAWALRDFMHLRECFFELYAIELRRAAEQNSYSVQEKTVSALLGAAWLDSGERTPVASIFDLFDFYEVETTTSSDANRRVFEDVDFSGCLKEDRDAGFIFDIEMAKKLLILRKRELVLGGTGKDAAEELQMDDEIRALLFSLITQNNFRAIQNIRLTALEAWTDLLSLVVAKGGLKDSDVVSLAVQALQVVLPRYDKSLSYEDSDAAGLLAKLVLTLTHAVTPALRDQSQQTANIATERLHSVFRITLKAITDSGTDLALRDVCYRTVCAILAATSGPTETGRSSTPAINKQLLQLIQNAGDRLITVITEDTFSGRGITRISSLLFLDGLVTLFQHSKNEASILRALTKLNFVPVLVDTSIGSVSAAFGAEDELVVSLAYFHTALALLLRLCQSPDGTQLVLNSNLLSAIDESRLFSTDPDIGFDIDNPAALKEFYRMLAEVVRVLTAAVLTKGPQAAKAFLKTYRPTVHAIFKRTSRESGNSEIEDVADEMSRLILATGFLEDDTSVNETRINGFT